MRYFKSSSWSQNTNICPFLDATSNTELVKQILSRKEIVKTLQFIVLVQFLIYPLLQFDKTKYEIADEKALE